MPTPKAFISYSWSDKSRPDWVLALAEQLTANGVEVLLDQWDVKYGQDVASFMERMNTDASISHVLVICDASYKAKADQRKGGVGIETHIITPDVYASADQTKFVPIVAEYNDHGEACVPVYMRDRWRVDLSAPDRFAEGFTDLLRHLFEAPKRVRPPLGAPPAFLSEPSSGPHGPVLVARSVLTAQLGRNAERALPAFVALMDAVFRELDSLVERRDVSAEVLTLAESVPEKAAAARDAVVAATAEVAKADLNAGVGLALHDFFERCLELLNPTAAQTSWRDEWFEPIRFVVQEMFLCVVAVLVRHDRFDDIDSLLEEPYFYTKHQQSRTTWFTEFRSSVRVYDVDLKQARNDRAISYSTALSKQRLARASVTFDEFMLADFVCFLRWALPPRNPEAGPWFPVSLIYRGYHPEPFDLFYRAKTGRYLAKVKRLLKVDSGAMLAKRFAEAVETKGIGRHQFGHETVDYARLLNLRELECLV